MELEHKLQNLAANMFLNDVPLGRDVTSRYVAMAERCMRAVERARNRETAGRAMEAWMFWMRQAYGKMEVENRRVIESINR
jgi:hypothetical protein